MVAGCADDESASNPEAGAGAAGPTTTIAIGPQTPTDPTRIRSAEAQAIIELGQTGADVPHSAHSHGHSDGSRDLEVPLFTGDAATFANQWLAAEASVPNFDTLDEAKALGYVRASAPSPGVGTHWVLWSQVAKPFDPAHPAMLLYDETEHPAMLVGYSYWLQSAEPPVGFVGSNDHWHQHTGLCVVNGWVDREESIGPSACAGTWLAGGDLWMLHAWPVPGWHNRLGRFASTHPSLCPSRYGTPDILRCPGT
jgi:hypothetical protein